MSVTLFGLSNCDTVRKARKALEAADIPFTFHDFRKDGLSRSDVEAMIAAIGSEVLVNRRGTTWRALPDADKALADGDGLADILIAHPAIIKRPVWKRDEEFLVGFAPKDAEARLTWAGGST